jgi:hypothetical protein
MLRRATPDRKLDDGLEENDREHRFKENISSHGRLMSRLDSIAQVKCRMLMDHHTSWMNQLCMYRSISSAPKLSSIVTAAGSSSVWWRRTIRFGFSCDGT